MTALVVLAHPLAGSLSHRLAEFTANSLRAAGQEAILLDLYAEDFDPRLTVREREAYYGPPIVEPSISRHAALLAAASSIVFVFPTWWFGPPAILKGWIDRVFAPGIAFDHSPGNGPIVPRLAKLRRAVVVTTLGTPRWVDMFVMRRPVRRMFKTAIIGGCAPKALFSYLALYSAEAVAEESAAAFERRIESALAG